MRCICPPDSVPIGRGSKPVRPTAAIAPSTVSRSLRADAAEQAFAPPQPHRHHVVDADREAAVDLGDLRQIGDVLRPHAVALDPAGERLDDADHALEQRRLAGAVRADHGGQRAGPHRAVEMMHGRMAVVAERQIAELQLRGHRRSSPHRPERRGPDQRDQPAANAEPLQRRQPQDRRMHRGRRMDVAGWW